jgi:diadenosine tetraphosphate (Ap4A) HIT family hydrolase
MSGYDIIGDLHGEAKKLVGLLDRLGYEKTKGVYRHPDRQAIFVGDLIDRGEQQIDVLKIVRRMQKAGAAQVVMGNHEFNAIAYATEDPRRPGHFMREHNDKNDKQHKQFLQQFTPKERAKLIRWFKTMPLWLDLDGFRVVHACWHERSMQVVERALQANELSDDNIFVEAATKGTDLYNAVEVLLKGPELSLEQYELPPFLDKGGHAQKHARIRWWNGTGRTLREMAEIQPDATQENGDAYPRIEDLPSAEAELAYAYHDTKPIFFGHYWRQWPPKRDLDWTDTAASVDFSAGAGGPLVAYRWDGESTLSDASYMEYPKDPDWAFAR